MAIVSQSVTVSVHISNVWMFVLVELTHHCMPLSRSQLLFLYITIFIHIGSVWMFVLVELIHHHMAIVSQSVVMSIHISNTGALIEFKNVRVIMTL